jgi:ribokinase
MDGFAQAGISPQVRRQQDLPTGTALITVDDHGENAIVVDSGANARLVDLDPDELATVAEAGILLMQLEIPLATVTRAAQHAKQSGTLVVLNAAPMQDLPEELLAAVDVLIVNETEAARLTDASDPDAAARRLSDLVPNVIITIGSDGAVIAGRDAEPHHVPGHQVEVVDTTGAGDTFCGALAAELARNARAGGAPDLIAAVEFAVKAAALSVQSAGAVPSIPTRQQIDRFG